MEIIKILKADIIDALTKIFHWEDESIITVEAIKDRTFGDYSSNVAMRLAKPLNQSPQMIAQSLKDYLQQKKEYHVEIAGNGFINFRLEPAIYNNLIKEIISKRDQFGAQNYGGGLSYNVEFVSANPTGDLHIGHARQAALGDSICRLYQFVGFNVTREFYLNDCGNQIIKLGESLRARYNQLLGNNIPLPEDGYHGLDLIEIAKAIEKDSKDKYLNDFSSEALSYFMEAGVRLETEKLKRDLASFRTNFDVFSSEKKIRGDGKIEEVLNIFESKGATYRSEDALWFKSTLHGDDKDRVLVKSDGSYTYLLPDIAYHKDKMSRHFNYLVNILGADHHGYLMRMKAALIVLGYKAEQLEFVIVQMVRLIKDGQELKMSKRTGNTLTIQDLIEEVGIDAARYIFASRASNAHLDIDINLLTKQSNENPVFYVQYAHARICSILENALKEQLVVDPDTSLLSTEPERALMVMFDSFKDAVLEAALTRSPHKLTYYLQKLAQTFHSFYNECRVIDQSNKKLSKSRLSLVESARIILKNGLSLIGVNAPEKM